MKQLSLYIILIVCISLYGCNHYSFTGASISPDVKSINIDFFQNRASLIHPSLSQIFTEKLKEKFVSQTNLRLLQENGDLSFSGYISDYRTQPVAIQGTESAALNRLSIAITVKFSNIKDEKQNFEHTFTRFADFDAKKNLNEVELSLIDEITKQLVDDIFNKSMSNW